MKALDDLISRLKSFDVEMIKVIESVIRDNEAIILDMNSEDQLFERGVTRTGEEISNFAPYSSVTVEIKQMKGQPTGRVTLRDEGDFHHSFQIEYESEGFKITASDWKTDMLVSGYGEEILGLTDENFRELAVNYVAPVLTEFFKTL